MSCKEQEQEEEESDSDSISESPCRPRAASHYSCFLLDSGGRSDVRIRAQDQVWSDRLRLALGPKGESWAVNIEWS